MRSDHLVDVRSPQVYPDDLIACPATRRAPSAAGTSRARSRCRGPRPRAKTRTFKSADELLALYRARGVDCSKPVTTYCRIGERSSHTWFVLRELLGFGHVRTYDGSWTEWGNLIGVPIAQGA